MASKIQQVFAMAIITFIVTIIAREQGATQLQSLGISCAMVLTWSIGFAGGLSEKSPAEGG